MLGTEKHQSSLTFSVWTNISQNIFLFVSQKKEGLKQTNPLGDTNIWY